MAYFGPNPQTIQSGSLDSLRNLSDLSNTAVARTNLSVPSQAEFDKALTTDPESFTPAQQGQARANIGTDVLGGFRNKLINPNWQVAQRATSGTIAAASIGYVGDRWLLLNGTDQSLTWNFADARDRSFILPGHVDRYLYFNFSAPPTSGSIELLQRIENVRSVPEGKATWRMYAAAPTPINCLMYLGQNFGSGGSSPLFPSEIGVISTTSDFTELNAVFDVPSTAGKTFGTNNYALFEIALNPRSTGPYSFACASLVIGDASTEDDPSSPRHIQQELALCQRYYRTGRLDWDGDAIDSVLYSAQAEYPPMRATPTGVLTAAQQYAFSSNPISVPPAIGHERIVAYRQATATASAAWITTFTLDAEL